jgi:hypothetical protein
MYLLREHHIRTMNNTILEEYYRLYTIIKNEFEIIWHQKTVDFLELEYYRNWILYILLKTIKAH